MPPNLPGFYYDEQRRKYFKIIPNQHATARFSHSKAAVDEERMRYRLNGLVQEGKELEEWHNQLRKTRVKRNHLLQVHPLGGTIGLRREVGYQEGHTDFATAAIWAKGLERYEFIEKSTPPEPEPTRNIRQFVRDPGTGAIAWTEDWSDYPSHVNVPQ
ncbi:MAG: hypothetical protein LQ338_000708 [Usnochroma carphineum]|nr:MAG: hypothetical protein LQ338_000708 [Usnochroma carphineum]